MPVHTSVNVMLQRLHGLEDTTDLTEWQNEFVKNVWRSSLGARRTSVLTEKQVETIEELFKKHFAS